MINPNPQTIFDVFASSNAKLSVPIYQRKYQWGISHLEELISDLHESMSSSKPLFLGNFIFDTHNPECYDIIDGQQRITTLSLLIVALRERAKQLNQPKLVAALQGRLTFIDQLGEEKGSRVIVSSSIKELYQYIIMEDRDGIFVSNINGVSVKKQINKIKPLYQYLIQTLENKPVEELNAIIKTLRQAYVIVLEFKDIEDAYDIFERTNARGLDLNIDDLLKNHIFSKSENDEQTQETWEAIVEKAGGTLPRMLKYFWISRKGPIVKKVLYKSIKDYSSSLGVDKMIEELNEFANFYKLSYSADLKEMQKRCEDFGLQSISLNKAYCDDMARVFQALSLFKVTQPLPLIFSVLKSYRDAKVDNYKKLYAFLVAIENYHFNNNIITTRVGHDVEKLYADHSLVFYDTADRLSEVDRLIQLLRNKRSKKEEFVAKFTDICYDDGTAMLAYIFDKYNNYNKKGGQQKHVFDPDPTFLKNNYNVEHILAQKNKQDSLMSQEEKDKIDNIGNLLVISRHSNSGLGSKSVQEKFALLEEGIYSDGLTYVTEFVKRYKDNSTNRNSEVIDQRAKDMAIEAYENVWNF